MLLVYCQQNSLAIVYVVFFVVVAEHIPKPPGTGIPADMGVDFLPVSKQDSKEGIIFF